MVIALGVVSLLTDASSEMIFPLLPAFFAARLGAAPLLLGTMEGVADLVSSLVKGWAGRWSDRSPRLRPLVVLGYSLSALARPLMAGVTLWWQPLLIRAGDRVGKGLRSTPRDALIARAADDGRRATAFSFHRSMDHAGAAVGALLCSGLLAWGLSAEKIFLLAAVPGWLAVLVIAWVREPEPVRDSPARSPETTTATGPSTRTSPELDSGSVRSPLSVPLTPVPRRLFFYLAPVALFGLANATDAFLLLKLSEQGARPQLLPLAWLGLHVTKALASVPAGMLADRIGSAKVVLAGWSLYAITYLGLAYSSSVTMTLTVIGFYGLYHALSEGAEKSLLVSLAPVDTRGRALGLYHLVSGVSALVAGLAFGAVWYRWSSHSAFLLAGAVAAASAGLLALLLPRAAPPLDAGSSLG